MQGVLFEHAVAGPLGIHDIDYVTAMVATIGLWVVLAPAVGAIAGATKSKDRRKGS